MKYLKEFTEAIHNKTKLKITYHADKYGGEITRLCAPMDVKSSAVSKDNTPKFHFWDYEGSKGKHVTSKLSESISSLETTSIPFNPSEFVSWNTNWGISRDWGEFS
tara:strand:- start:778 stop:1095 length:318 start_codon:yes stop_codon:yes gene_type:complete